MKLGLGLGLSTAQRQSNYEAITADWMSWDGSNDGTISTMFSAGGVIAIDIVAVSDSEAILFWHDSTGNGKCVVLDVDADLTFKPETTNSAISVSIDEPDGANIIALSDTLFIILAEDNVTGALECSLISKSGKILTEIDNAVIDVTFEATLRNGLAFLNNTQAVFIAKESADSDDARIGVIDVSGNDITVGSLVDLNEQISDFPSICGLTANSFMAVTQKKVFYCTVSGVSVTVEASMNISSSGTVYDDVMIARIDEQTVLVSYETASAGSVDVNSFSWNGASLSRGVAQADIFSGNDIFQGTGTVTALGQRQVMFSGRQNNEAVWFSAAVVCHLDEMGNITVGDVVQTSADVRAPYAIIDATPSRLYVYAAYRDSTNTPLNQIGTRILKGF
ncbi:MAG: hypothetical protein CMH32_07875 [Micavibrio sp.]|nr:hypothetical protein [Micavibrio sp.]